MSTHDTYKYQIEVQRGKIMAGKGKIDNLVKAEDLTTDELRNRAKKAGKASGKARRDKREQKQIILDVLSMPLKEGSVEEITSLVAAKGANLSINQAIVIAQVQKALKGDTKAAEYLRDTAGQKPTDKVQLNAGVNIDDTINRIDTYLKGREKHETGIS